MKSGRFGICVALCAAVLSLTACATRAGDDPRADVAAARAEALPPNIEAAAVSADVAGADKPVPSEASPSGEAAAPAQPLPDEIDRIVSQLRRPVAEVEAALPDLYADAFAFDAHQTMLHGVRAWDLDFDVLLSFDEESGTLWRCLYTLAPQANPALRASAALTLADNLRACYGTPIDPLEGADRLFGDAAFVDAYKADPRRNYAETWSVPGLDASGIDLDAGVNLSYLHAEGIGDMYGVTMYFALPAALPL